jgi:hypothetical protein
VTEDAIPAGLHPAQLFHVGVTAVDFEGAKAEMSRNLGVAWKGGRPTPMEIVLGDEARTIEMRIAHTVQGPPHIELIQCVPDTPWAEVSRGVHHLCYWSDDAVAACAALESAGARRVMGRAGSGGGYLRTEAGMLIEIIGPPMRDYLTALARGELDRTTRAPR